MAKLEIYDNVDFQKMFPEFEWAFTFGKTPEGEIVVPADLYENPFVATFFSSIDGHTIYEHKGRVYISAKWVKENIPKLAPIIDKITDGATL